MKIWKKIWGILFVLAFFCGFPSSAQTVSNIYNTIFFQNLNDLNIPISNLLLKPTLSRYDFTRLLNAVECQDCVMPTEDMAIQYNESFWSNFKKLPGNYFSDIDYLGGTHNGTNYYYCVAKVGNNDFMNGYPLGSSTCGGQFCGQRNVTKAEFFQTLSNLLMDRQMFYYTAPWKEIKERFHKLKTTDFKYRYFNEAQIALINSKPNETQTISSRLEYTTYLGYCTFNPENCGFQTFPSLAKNVWPLAEVNILIKAGVITASDVTALSTPISPSDAVEKIQLIYELHTKCDFDNDYDCDGIPNHEDNCPYTYNPAQSDIDGDVVGDVCDDDIDGDGERNPVGLVDDNGKINYGLLKKFGSHDKTPLGDQVNDTAFFIQVSNLDQKFPAYVQFEIIGPEAPASVEWDFGDLGTAKGKSVSHTYNNQGLYTITAKVTTQKRKEFLLSTQIFFGNTTDTSYNLNIDDVEINKKTKTATFQANFQGNFDYLQRENTAIGSPQKIKPGGSYTTKLIESERNNITVKGYVNNVLVAVATTDVYANNGDFYTFVPHYSPLLKRIGSKISTTLKLVNISTNNIDHIAWDYGDSTTFFDSKLITYHTYSESGKKILIQKLNLDNGKELIATSSLNIQDPNIVGNQTYNIVPASSDNIKISFQNIGLNLTNQDILSTTLNGEQSYYSNDIQDHFTFLEIGDRLGIVRVNTKLNHGNLTLVNKGIVSLGTKHQSGLNLENVDELFSGLHCDLDKDGIPDIYDDDIDGDGVPNLLGLIFYEKEDCSLNIGENVDEILYNKHFGICSLDNCIFRGNPNQADLNANTIGDICESEGVCGNGVIDPGEDCKSCPQDVSQCTAFCGNKIKELAENCKNCPADMKTCPSLCGDGKIDESEGEECDNGSSNGKDKKCSIACTRIMEDDPNCGNGIIDPGETCITCPLDLGDICIEPGISSCGNGIIDPGETCLNCPDDVGTCTAICPDGKQDDAENCKNCPNDMMYCPSLCGNGIIDTGEECDSGELNGTNGKCGFDCKKIDSNNPNCGNGIIDPGEDCNNCSRDLQDLCIESGGGTCGNGVLEEGETCLNCPIDAGSCSGFCGNGTIESSETCQNCPEDVGKCTGSCGNGVIENGEECDNGSNNGDDGKCSISCKLVDSKQICGNKKVEGTEKCDNGDKNGTPGNNCTLKCTFYDSDHPNCGNGEVDAGESCDNCAIDLGDKCLYSCGNGKIELGEECDDGDLNGKNGLCTFECEKQNQQNIFCGNGKKESENGEECDDGDNNGKNGKCSLKCKKINKAKCGNGVIDEGEQCDLGKDRNGKVGSTCASDCTEIVYCPNGKIDQYENCQTCPEDAKDACITPWTGECGNGIIEEGETCLNCPKDTGSCSAFCGNGVVEEAEDCNSCPEDLGRCTGSCGNGEIEKGEECDNGGNNGYDGKCSINCKNLDPEHYCGDGIKDTAEECDDGVFNGTSKSENNCSIMCTLVNPFRPNCGNGVVDPGENCLNCPADLGGKCLSFCGNGVIEIGEQCDDGSLNGKNGSCTFECKKQENPNIYCGNSKKEGDEECDNGSNNGNDGICNKNCKMVGSPTCGNGIREADEECDLGKLNGTLQSNCSKGCKEINLCPNDKIDKEEDCQNCPQDLGILCIGDGTADPICGNGVVEDGEDCKNCPTDIGECNAYCGNGNIESAEDCQNCPDDVGGCSGSCGNAILEDGEQCDNGSNNGYDGKCSLYCRNIDTEHYCGDGIKDDNEVCDAGPKNGTLEGGCTLMCTRYDPLRPNCGNGVVDPGENCLNCPADLGGKCLSFCGNNKIEIGEECDDGKQNGKNGQCSFSCKKTSAKCGNGKKEGEEKCDHGEANGTAGDNCSTECRIIEIPFCGDGIVGEGEECDLRRLNGVKGSGCDKDCKEEKSCPNNEIDMGENCDNCPLDLGEKCVTDAICGNGILENDEECDDGRRNGKSGACSKDCKTGNPNCGNGKIDPDETCLNCPDDVGECTAACGNGIIEDAENCYNCPDDVGECTGSCGNGVLEEGEQCDHGDKNGKDKKCSSVCKLIVDPSKPYCGDGNIDTELGEKCDDGSNNGKGSCSYICTTIIPGAKCGNGDIDPGENCNNCPADLGNKCLGSCGNGIIDAPWEECDHGANNGRDGACSTQCKNQPIAVCGNGVQEEGEECDHGANNGKDKKCTSKCTLYNPTHPNCGDGKVDSDENCMNCYIDVGLCTGSCGNGTLEDGEQCDHGTRNGSDGLCDKNCRDIDPNRPCGNGFLDDGEECDLGNLNGQGQCSYNCKNVTVPNCGNGDIDPGETCNNCFEDLGIKCLGNCGNNTIETGEECDNGANNGKDGICSEICMDVNSCGNDIVDPGEDCQNCSRDLKDLCIGTGVISPVNCGNGVIDPGEKCNNCPQDVGECTASCGNGIIETPEQCDKGANNGKNGSNCSINCKNTDPLHYCGNKKVEEDLGEQCDLGKSLNGTRGSNCTVFCTFFDPNTPDCGNGVVDPNERCDNCPRDLGDLCIGTGIILPTNCGNGKIDPNERCDNCPHDVGECTASCGNGIIEIPEECDKGINNGKRGSNCSTNCRNTDSLHYCGNKKVEEDLGEQCDLGEELNGARGSNCTVFCTFFDSNSPDCGNGVVDPNERCDNCPRDLGDLCKGRCGDGIVNGQEECDPRADNGEEIICSDQCKIIGGKPNTKCEGEICNDIDCDGVPDPIDNCQTIPGQGGDTACLDPGYKRDPGDDGCPNIPDNICEDGDCPLVKVVCNSCPCQFADYSNTLQKDDAVRARLWDKNFMVHYNYSDYYPLGNLFY